MRWRWLAGLMIVPALAGCGSSHHPPKPVVRATRDTEAVAVLTSRAALVSAMGRSAVADPAKLSACDVSVLIQWESTTAAGYLHHQHGFPSVKTAHGKTTTGDPKVYARRYSGGQGFLDQATGRIAENVSAEQRKAYAAWLADPAVVKANYDNFRNRYLGFLDAGNPC